MSKTKPIQPPAQPVEADLPEGWTFATMGDVAEVVGGGTPKSTDSDNFADEGHPWITPADLSSFEETWIERGRRGLTDKGLAGCSARLVPAGTVLMSSRAPIGYVAVAANELCTNQGFKSFILADGLDSEFVYYWLRFTRGEIEQMGSGSTFMEVSGGRCREIPIVFPPIAEQKRIVAKVVAVLARVNAGRARLAKAPSILKRFRQSVLASLLRGEETPMGDILTDLKYGTARKCGFDRKGVPVLRIPNIAAGFIDQTELKYAKLDRKELKSLRLQPNDILLIRSNGSVSLLGKTAIVSSREDGYAYAGYLMRLRIDARKADSRYVHLALSTQDCRDQIEMPARSTSGVHNINSGEVRQLRLALPALSEQREIVRRVEKLFALADTIEKRVSAATARAEKLTQAILAKAFRGELVPTEADLARQEGRQYETAEQLLARVRAAPESTESPGARRHGRRPKRGDQT